MGLLNLASGASAWRGFDYYKSEKVKSYQQTGEGIFEGQVAGSDQKQYHVVINLNHPRSSKCTCPLANGKRIVCKHQVALYFTAFPDAAQDYYNSVIKAQTEDDDREEELEQAVVDRVLRMKKDELQQVFLQLLFNGPKYQYERFLKDYVSEYWD